MSEVRSPYERQLIKEFQEKLMKHLSRPKVENRLKRTGKIDKEIKKFAKRYDSKYRTDFFSTLKG